MPRCAAAWVEGIHRSGSNSPRIITSSGAGTACGLVVSQPRPASARRVRISENSVSSAVSSQAKSMSASAAAACSVAAALTARSSGSPGGMTIRSRGRVCLRFAVLSLIG